MIKRTITALMLSLGIPASGNTDSPAVPDDTPLTQNQLNEIELLSVAENFNGRQSLDEITALLQSGLNINAQDTEGNTPLLLLCRALELDYRYSKVENAVPYDETYFAAHRFVFSDPQYGSVAIDLYAYPYGFSTQCAPC